MFIGRMVPKVCEWTCVSLGMFLTSIQASDGIPNLVGGLEHVFHILGSIIPIDFHIFQMGRYTTNQKFDWVIPGYWC